MINQAPLKNDAVEIHLRTNESADTVEKRFTSSIRVAHRRTCGQPQCLVAPFGHEQGNYGKKTVPEERGYRAYFFSASDHIRDVRGIKVSRDLDAKAEAQALLAKSEYAFVEVYEEWRLVWRSDRERLVA